MSWGFKIFTAKLGSLTAFWELTWWQRALTQTGCPHHTQLWHMRTCVCAHTNVFLESVTREWSAVSFGLGYSPKKNCFLGPISNSTKKKDHTSVVYYLYVVAERWTNKTPGNTYLSLIIFNEFVLWFDHGIRNKQKPDFIANKQHLCNVFHQKYCS